MSKFKVGAKVRVVADGFAHALKLDTLATVLRVDDRDSTLYVNGIWRVDGSEVHQWVRQSDVVLIQQKIVVTTDGVTTTARLFSGKELVKSATAKCSPRDEFDFKIGAGVAVSRLLNTEEKAEPEVPKFDKSQLVSGVFGRMKDGRWFVVCGDRLLYGLSEGGGVFDGGFDYISTLDDHLEFKSGACVDFLIDRALSFKNAQDIAKLGHFLWFRPDAKV